MNESQQRVMSPAALQADISAVSWGAILAGAAAALALTLVLLALGAGVGFAVVSPWPHAGVSATTFSIGAGLYLIVVAMLASSVGGFIAGRLRTRWTGAHADEVYFRDTAHGLLAWAVATILGASVLAGTASDIVTSASSGIARSATTAAMQATSAFDGQLDKLLRPDFSGASRTEARPAAEGAETRAELTRLLSGAFGRGDDLAAADRSYATQLIAARTGLAPTEVDRRLNVAVGEAKEAADRARRTARNFALWLTASLLVGAFSASLAATEGGARRDGTWSDLRPRPV